MKDAQATGEASSLQKKTSITLKKLKHFFTFLFLWVIFANLVQIQSIKTYADPDLQQCFNEALLLGYYLLGILTRFLYIYSLFSLYHKPGS
jgi:hypothetical protein